MQDYDVAVIGGGPVGGYVAEQIAKENYKVAIFEKSKEIGLHLNCAGLITPRVFDFLSFSQDTCVQNKIMGANIHSPSDKILSIGGDKVHALVIDRKKFDQQIIKQAETAGAELFLQNNVLSVKKRNDVVELKTSQNINVKSKLLIGADGPHSKTRDRFAFSEPVEFLRGIGAEVKNVNLKSDFVEIFVGNKVAPGFFAWVIPTNEKGTEARIGLCINQNAKHSPKYYFEKLFENKNSKKFLEESIITRNIGGIIPLGALKKTYSSNVMLVGDAAAQVKPTSGGGIYPGLLCAKICSNVAINALEKNNFSEKFLKKYHKRWTSEYTKNLSFGMKFRKRYCNLSDDQFDKYIEKFSNPKIVETISKYGDIDYPSKLVKPLIKKLPTLVKIMTGPIKK